MLTRKAASAAFFMNISRSFAFGLMFFVLSWLAFDHYRPWLNFHSELLAFVGLFGLFVSVLLQASGPVVALPKICVFVAVVCLLPWLQYFTGVNYFAGDALLSSLYLSGLLVAICVGYFLWHAEGDRQSVALTGVMCALWIAALISSAIGLAQWLHVDGPLGVYVVQSDWGDRAMGNLGQPNQLATLLLMGMVAFAYIFERGVIGRIAFVFGICFMTLALLPAQSRTGMLSVLIVTIYMMWRKGSVRSRLSGKAVACWAACFLIATLVFPYLNEFLLLSDASDARGIGSPESTVERWRLWQQIGSAVMQSPWSGFGWNQTATAQAAAAIAYPGKTAYTYAHNFLIDMLAWNGIPLGMFLVGAVAYWFVTRLYSSNSRDSVYAMACLLPLAVHSMLEYPFAYAYFLIAGGLMVGGIEAGQYPKKAIALQKCWAWVFLAVWVPIGGYLTVEYFLIEEDFQMVRFENLHLGKTPESYKIPDFWMVSHMVAMLKSRRISIEPGMQKVDLETLRVVSHRFPDNVLHFRYALALALNGAPSESKRQLAIIRGMYGNEYYAACNREFLRLQKEKYPQLVAVNLP